MSEPPYTYGPVWLKLGYALNLIFETAELVIGRPKCLLHSASCYQVVSVKAQNNDGCFSSYKQSPLGLDAALVGGHHHGNRQSSLW